MTIEDPLVLLVDDLEATVELMRIVFTRSGYVRPLQTVFNGEQAVAYLRGDGDVGTFKQFGMPTVVLLDLNMPRMGGFEVLAWIRQQPELKHLFVCILSASSELHDIERAYDLGANCYMVKPGNLNGLLHMASTLLAWIRLIHFPIEDTVDAGIRVGSLIGTGAPFDDFHTHQAPQHSPGIVPP